MIATNIGMLFQLMHERTVAGLDDCLWRIRNKQALARCGYSEALYRDGSEDDKQAVLCEYGFSPVV